MSLVIVSEKHPADELDYAIDFSNYLTGGDSISDFSVMVSPGIILGADSKAPGVTNGAVVFWLSGGESGVTYYFSVSIVSANGRSKTVEGSVTVMDPSPF